MNPTDLLLLHLGATWALVGLIWTIQLVQYPGFAHVAPQAFSSFHAHHCARITWIVAPLMVLELFSGVALVWVRPNGVSSQALWVGLGLIALNWLWTALVAMPLHQRVNGFAPRAQAHLVATNWVRTIAWSARGVWTLALARGLLERT